MHLVWVPPEKAKYTSFPVLQVLNQTKKVLATSTSLDSFEPCVLEMCDAGDRQNAVRSETPEPHNMKV